MMSIFATFLDVSSFNTYPLIKRTIAPSTRAPPKIIRPIIIMLWYSSVLFVESYHLYATSPKAKIIMTKKNIGLFSFFDSAILYPR